MEMEGRDEKEELLRLRLAIVADSGTERKKKRKRVLRETLDYPLTNLNEVCEGKIFRLLEMREQMLKLDQTRKNKVSEEGNGLQLIHLLLLSATALDHNNPTAAAEHLGELYRTASLTGDSVQRVAAYFGDGLVAKLLTRKSPFYDMIMKHPTPEEEFLAFTQLYKASPYYQFAHFTANQAILEAYEAEEKSNNRALHVIDFDVSYGFQWPSLIQSLSEKATMVNRISLRITGFGRNLEELQETEARLAGFAKGFRNLVFEFQGLLRGSRLVNLRKKKNETVAANLIFYLDTLNTRSKISETLESVNSLNPSVVILVEQEGSCTPRSFLSRFMESLHYYAAMFDSLDDCLPLDSSDRLRIEKNHLGKEIKNITNYDKNEGYNCQRHEQRETWKERMEGHGFVGIKLSSKCMMQAKLLLKIRNHCCPIQVDGENGGFRVIERDDGRAVSLGWQDRCLITASAWHYV